MIVKVVFKNINTDMISDDFAHYWKKEKDCWVPLGAKGNEFNSIPIEIVNDTRILMWLFGGYCILITQKQFDEKISEWKNSYVK